MLRHTFLIAVILFEIYPLVSLRCYLNILTTPLNKGHDKKICQLNQKDVPSLRVLHSLCSSILVKRSPNIGNSINLSSLNYTLAFSINPFIIFLSIYNYHLLCFILSIYNHKTEPCRSSVA